MTAPSKEIPTSFWIEIRELLLKIRKRMEAQGGKPREVKV